MISTIVSCRRREEKKMKKNKRIELVYWNWVIDKTEQKNKINS
jgi:hypothetical protein